MEEKVVDTIDTEEEFEIDVDSVPFEEMDEHFNKADQYVGKYFHELYYLGYVYTCTVMNNAIQRASDYDVRNSFCNLLRKAFEMEELRGFQNKEEADAAKASLKTLERGEETPYSNPLYRDSIAAKLYASTTLYSYVLATKHNAYMLSEKGTEAQRKAFKEFILEARKISGPDEVVYPEPEQQKQR
jgi:hypothetical protein